MCGIIGYVGKNAAAPILIEGLKRLEYRGYDSAGLALMGSGCFDVFKKTGRVANVAAELGQAAHPQRVGISHTRWATHGGVTDANAHPHVSSDGKIALVHNGVIENHASLRRFLQEQGATFASETDTEVLANLIAYHYARQAAGCDVRAGRADPIGHGSDGSHTSDADCATRGSHLAGGVARLLAAVRCALGSVEGTYGIAVLAVDLPADIVGARKGSPLCVGVGNGENLLASDVSAFVGRTQNVVYLDDGQIVHLGADDFSILTLNEAELAVDPVISTIDWQIEQAELGAFSHYMEKEIFEQPQALENAMRGRFSDDGSTAKFGGLTLEARDFRQVDRLVFCACGSAWHACLVAEYLIEKYARIPVEVEYASEFRYRNAPLDKNTLVFVISQSGETLDTLEALREATRKGLRVLGITNGVGSTIARETEGGVYQHAGPEIGVASTKAFTSQVLIAGMLALYLGRLRDLSFSDGREMVKAFRSLPALAGRLLGQAEEIRAVARKYAHYNDFLFLGRQHMFPVALEGALKLKEISYIHAEGYPAAEMKHGPIALISEECPTVVLCPDDDTLPKILANIQEIRARKGRVIAVTSAGAAFPADGADDIIHIPGGHDCLMPILATIPLQILAYEIALQRGCDVDKPRNLAKSVTVE